jgi:hypothetical protein
MTQQAATNEETLVLDQTWVDGVYQRLGELEVDLDPDPLVYGPKRLNGKVADARNMLRDCEAIFLQASHDQHRFSRALRVATAKLKMSKDFLFANDPETRAGRNVADREAIATMKLQKQVKEVHRLEIGTEDLKAVLVVIKAKRADLKDVQGRLRDQMKLCQEEIALGGRWGSRRPNAPDLDPTAAPQVETDDIDELLMAVEGELHLEAEEESESEVEEAPVVEDAASEPEVVEPPAPAPAPAPELVLVESGGDEDEDEGYGDPFGEDEDEGDEDPRLAATATNEEVDTFLSDLSFDDPKDKPKSKRSADEDLDVDLDDLLSAFE